MKMKQKLLASAIALSALAGFTVPAAQAEVSAAIGAGNMYYWRGLDLGAGDASVWGDLKYSESGFYAGIWGGSGDATNGQEYDLYAGYGGEAGDFSYDLSVWTYSYPSVEISAGDLVEVVGTIGYGPVSFSYYEGMEDLEDYNYMTLSLALGQFTVKYGVHEDDLSHVDLTYAFNDTVSFTLGKVVDDVDGTYNDEAKFVVGFSLPIM